MRTPRGDLMSMNDPNLKSLNSENSSLRILLWFVILPSYDMDIGSQRLEVVLDLFRAQIARYENGIDLTRKLMFRKESGQDDEPRAS